MKKIMMFLFVISHYYFHFHHSNRILETFNNSNNDENTKRSCLSDQVYDEMIEKDPLFKFEREI